MLSLFVFWHCWLSLLFYLSGCELLDECVIQFSQFNNMFLVTPFLRLQVTDVLIKLLYLKFLLIYMEQHHPSISHAPTPNHPPPPPPQNPSTPWDSTCCHWTRCLINFPYYSSQANTKLGVYFPLNLLSVFQFVNKLSLLFILLHFTLVVVVSFFGVCGFNNNPMV